MGGTEKFCLKWNDFETSISSSFKDIRTEKDFLDVTLVTEEEEQLSAHKVILSACSPFFRNILRKNPHQHPLLYLKGVKFSDLQSVLNFMYHGEVNVAQDELNSFLSVAEELKVKGLTQNNSSSKEEKPSTTPQVPANTKTSRSAERESSGGPPTKRARPSQQSNQQAPSAAPSVQHHQAAASGADEVDDDDDIQEVIPAVKSEPNSSVISGATASSGGAGVGAANVSAAGQEMYEGGGEEGYEEAYAEEDYSYAGAEGFDDSTVMDPNMSQGSGGVDGNKGAEIILKNYAVFNKNLKMFQCTICNKQTARKANLFRHLESIHFPNSFMYTCEYCQEMFSTKKKKEHHLARFHRDRKDYATVL